jgi:hypothetical protein
MIVLDLAEVKRMAEYIEREAAIDFVKNNTPTIDGETTMQCVERSLKNAPAAEVVEVVRCKDCRYFREYTKDYKQKVEKADGACYFRVMYSVEEQYGAVQCHDYCSLGAKMDGKGEGE